MGKNVWLKRKRKREIKETVDKALKKQKAKFTTSATMKQQQEVEELFVHLSQFLRRRHAELRYQQAVEEIYGE